jgi:hypothetical protein
MGEQGVVDDAHRPGALTLVGKDIPEIWTIVERAAG